MQTAFPKFIGTHFCRSVLRGGKIDPSGTVDRRHRLSALRFAIVNGTEPN
jgi:hypothetical protein